MLGLIDAILGGALLVAGRKIFWLFVGAVGFIIGIEIASRFFHGSELLTLIIGLGLGVIFAVLTMLAERIAIGIAGFLGGGYLLLTLAGAFGLDKGALTWIIFIVGGLIGLALIGWLFDWALITISVFAGASLIINAFHLQSGTGGVVFLILAAIGFAIQASALRREKHPVQSSERR